ncbi:MAG: hypothetical protein U0804_10205 [Gemmataceae bacterium]
MPRLLVALVSALLVAGCGSGDGKEAVSGTITLKSQPFPNGGLVTFEPLENQNTAAPAVVTDGKYDVPRQNGLKPGRYRVWMTAGDGKTAVNPVDSDQPPGPGGGANIVSKDVVPAAWGRDSKQEVTVKAGGPNVFNFDIP